MTFDYRYFFSLFLFLIFIVITTIFIESEAIAQNNNIDQNNNITRKVLWVEVKDFISTATVDDISSAIQKVSENNEENSSSYYSAIVLALDTPGGSLDATLDILQSIQQSTVPVITYVYPQGRSAWSAGTVILLAGDYASMAPFTTIGSSQPVLGNQPINDTKIINALKEKLVSLSDLHDRNQTQAERFVTNNDNLTPEKALRYNIIESVSNDQQHLLLNANNFTAHTLNGNIIIDTENAEILKHQPSIRVLLLNIIANPLISTLFFSIGFLALIFGLTSPGLGVEIAGVILIILSLIGQGFDINWVAFAILGLGGGLIIYELYSPGFGVLGVVGIVILSLGTILMITQPIEPLLINEIYFQNLSIIAILLILPFSGFIIFITYKVWESKNRKRKKIDFVLFDYEGIAIDSFSSDSEGFVLVGGEYWKARCKTHIEKGMKVRIVDKIGSILIVDPFPSKK